MNQDDTFLLREKYQGTETPDFQRDRERLWHGEPLAYVIGHIPFLNTKIFLESRPLIPRPETEWWVELFLKSLSSERAVRILDLCAGSGAIGVAVLKNLPLATVTFAEIDPSHHETITKNILENSIDPKRASVVSGDLFENISDTFDVILTNPPYIDPALDRVAASVKDFEPSIALYGGTRGLEIIERLISASPSYVSPEGSVWIEHEPEQAEMIARLAAAVGFSSESAFDQFGTLRYSILKKPVAQ